MNTIISTVLISAPLAFLVGWVLCKAVMKTGPVVARRVKSDARADARIGVDDRDAQIAELQRQLDKAEARILKSKNTFKTWRERIRPIAHQFRQQRMIIGELRDELRRRDAAARQAEEAVVNQPESAPEPPPQPESEPASQKESPSAKAQDAVRKQSDKKTASDIA